MFNVLLQDGKKSWYAFCVYVDEDTARTFKYNYNGKAFCKLVTKSNNTQQNTEKISK